MRIAYYTSGTSAMASSRLRAWMIGEALAAMGHEVVFNPPQDQFVPNVAVFQKRFDLADKMAQMRGCGTTVIWDCDDYIEHGPVEHTDLITVDTPAKLEIYPMAMVIPDALDVHSEFPRKRAHRDQLQRVVWFGNADNYYHAANVALACRKQKLTFVAVTQIGKLSLEERALADELYEWTLGTVDYDIVHADIAACSYVPDGRWSQEWVRSKSANRLLKAWGLGMPVIGTPIPSYIEAGLQHWATSVDQWVEMLEALRTANARSRDAQYGQAIANDYRAEKLALRWLEVFETCTQPH